MAQKKRVRDGVAGDGSPPAQEEQPAREDLWLMRLAPGERFYKFYILTERPRRVYADLLRHLTDLRARFTIPIVGMEPAVKPAAARTRSGRVGVLATPTTLQGDSYARLLARYAQGIAVIAQPCPGWVEWVEAGMPDVAQTQALVERYVVPLRAAGVDELVLGCTHYPFLRPWIERAAGPGIEIIDPAPAVARRARDLWLEGGHQPKEPSGVTYRFVTTGDAARFAAQLRQLLDWEGRTESLNIANYPKSNFG